jgi:hypothetical protein
LVADIARASQLLDCSVLTLARVHPLNGTIHDANRSLIKLGKQVDAATHLSDLKELVREGFEM